MGCLHVKIDSADDRFSQLYGHVYRSKRNKRLEEVRCGHVNWSVWKYRAKFPGIVRVIIGGGRS